MDHYAEKRRQLEEQQQEISRQLRLLEEDHQRMGTKIPINTGHSGASTPPRRSSVLGTPSPSARGASPSPLPPMTTAPLMPVVLRPGHEEYRATDGTEVQVVDHAGADNVTERWYTSPDGAVKEYERHRQAPGLEEHMRNEESHYATPNSETWNKFHSSSVSSGNESGSPAAVIPFEHQDVMRIHQQAVDRAMKQAQEQMNWATQQIGGGLSHAAFPALSGVEGFPVAGSSVADVHARAVRDAERNMQDMMRRSQEQMNQMMRTHQQQLDRTMCIPSPSHYVY